MISVTSFGSIIQRNVNEMPLEGFDKIAFTSFVRSKRIRKLDDADHYNKDLTPRTS